ncbi:Eco57I restriction-modification methylase domain-containing protein [Pilimelia columellifera]|uniref:site-specific DNA-methyltransferase (adenine-specific) n=1 Tax=Pilimelia columellifera subsp. columellifera TaxID=706583 RepID=A0ABN3NR50_9ACTN
MATEARFPSVRLEGGLLPGDLLTQVADGVDLPGLAPTEYGLPAGETLRQEASRVWERLCGAWAAFTTDLDRAAPAKAGHTRDRWLHPLLDALGYHDLAATGAGGLPVGERAFPVSHLAGPAPVHLLGWGVELDRRTPGLAGAAGAAPQSMCQELLNASDAHLWAVLSNGQRLRLLRDSTSLVGSAYVEFDLEAIFDGDLFADFALLLAMCHRSRVAVRDEAVGAASCWLERWRDTAAEQGTRARERMRRGVAEAIQRVGTGLLRHPDNTQLRKQLASGDLTTEDYQRGLLRWVYRTLFWFVAEDRDLLHLPDADPLARQRYSDYYSAAHLRQVARRRRGNRQSDLWHSVTLVWRALAREDGRPELGLTGLGGLFDSGPLDEPIDDAALANEDLLHAIRCLSVTTDDTGRRRTVDFRHLDAEELGSVYEQLLELHPHHDPAEQTFTLAGAHGSERKKSGSYYTPTALVDCLLDSTLNPLIDRAAAATDPQAALLALTVCDPACGSGHFLVGAARRIAKRLAAVRTGEAEPPPSAVREALREVVDRCVYGVDINPMAAELARISLWLETLSPGAPLTFLDANIRVGNSLLGATPALLAGGLPDETFKPILGDDKKHTSALAKRNRDERRTHTGQGTLLDESELRAAQLRLARTARDILDRETPFTLADAHVRQARHRDYEHSPELRHAREVADAWCAAFVWPKTPDAPPAITTRVLADFAADPLSLAGESRGELGRLTAAYRFFHWHLEFPHIFTDPAGDPEPTTGWTGGFTCVIGNVPWEHIELKEQEFFEQRAPEIAAAAGAKRKKLIAALPQTDPVLATAYEDAKRQLDGQRHFGGNSGVFPLTGRGRIKTDPLFAELGRSLIGPDGRFGIVLPTGIATDATTQYFFRDLVVTGALASLYDFENSKPTFENVHRSFKFCLLTMAGRGERVAAADFAFFMRDVADLARVDARFTLTPEEITLLNPNTGTCPVFRSRRDAEITLGIYRRVPVLVREGDPDGNPWGVSFMQGLFNMTSDSHLFHTRAELEADGWTLTGNTFTRGPATMLPLYEAKMIHHYDHRWATYEPDGTTRDVTLTEKQDPNFVVQPRYWVPAPDVDAKLANRWHHPWLLGWRDITNTTNERTTIASPFPRSGVGNNMPIHLSKTDIEMALLTADLASFAHDFPTRLKVGGTHLNFFIYEQNPALPPWLYRQRCPWSKELSLSEWLATLVKELIVTAWDMEVFAGDLGDDGPPFRWDVERRALLRAELDAAYFHLYGVVRDDVDYVMETFPIVKRKDIAAHGEFRTKRLILEIYDAMADAIVTGKPYQTILDPPPGHGPRHPAKTNK